MKIRANMLHLLSEKEEELYEPLQHPGAASGFPSPAQDYEQKRLHLSQLLIKDPTNTYYFKAKGHELTKFHIYDNDILVVDRSIKIFNNATIVCYGNGTWMVCEVLLHNRDILLSDKKGKLINLRQTDTPYLLWGVIRWICHSLMPQIKQQN